MKTAADILREARALIEDRTRWTRKAYARTASGKSTISTSQAACRWCVSGAIERVVEREWRDYNAAMKALARAAYPLYDAGPLYVNDRLGHAHVLRMLDRAIALAEATS